MNSFASLPYSHCHEDSSRAAWKFPNCQSWVEGPKWRVTNLIIDDDAMCRNSQILIHSSHNTSTPFRWLHSLVKSVPSCRLPFSTRWLVPINWLNPRNSISIISLEISPALFKIDKKEVGWGWKFSFSISKLLLPCQRECVVVEIAHVPYSQQCDVAGEHEVHFGLYWSSSSWQVVSWPSIKANLEMQRWCVVGSMRYFDCGEKY
mgnify:CR=1 FL=1